MELSTKQFIMGIIPANYFLWTADFAGGCLVLLLLVIIDFITGIRAAQKNGTAIIGTLPSDFIPQIIMF